VETTKSSYSAGCGCGGNQAPVVNSRVRAS
jgi:hypothetical protein